MADKQYKTCVGVVAFDPKDDKTGNGKEVLRCVLNVVGQGDVEVHLTVWKSSHPVEIRKGDWVLTRGEYSKNVSDGRTYHNVSAYHLAVVPGIQRVEAGTTAGAEPQGNDDDIPF